MKPGKIIKKPCSIVISIIIFLVVSEMILRTAGFFYFFSRRDRQIMERLRDGTAKHVILCLGDSFTFGGGLDPKYSYPRQLQDLFDASKARAKALVINGGLCEYNSSQVLENLPGNIRRYKPNIIVLLVGASNRFNFIGFLKDNSISSKLKQFVYRLRIYKIYKITMLNIRIKLFEIKAGKKIDKLSRELEQYAFIDAIDPDKHILEDVADANHDLIEYLRKIGEERAVIELFKKYTGEHQDPQFLQYQISEFMEDIFDGSNKDSKTIMADLQKKLEEAPDLKNNNSFFLYYYLFFKKIKGIYSDEKIDNWLRHDLEAIVDICRKNNIRVVIQEYPYPYPDANAVLRGIANKYALPLARNAETFGKLIMKEGKSHYFLDDSHCTASGYQIMAENVYKVIDESIFSK